MFINKKSFNFFLILSFLCVMGCIGKVQWIERKGGNPEEENWIPVCPSCKQVVNHEALQCVNPQCKTLLAWKDKTTYAKRLYHEEEQEKEGIPAPPSLIEETSEDFVIEKEKIQVEEKIKEAQKEETEPKKRTKNRR